MRGSERNAPYCSTMLWPSAASCFRAHAPVCICLMTGRHRQQQAACLVPCKIRGLTGCCAHVQVCALVGSTNMSLEEHVTLQGHTHQIYDIIWPLLSSRGSAILSAGSDSCVRLWDQSHWQSAVIVPPQAAPEHAAEAQQASAGLPSKPEDSPVLTLQSADALAADAAMPNHGRDSPAAEQLQQQAPPLADQSLDSAASEQTEAPPSPHLLTNGLSPIIESPQRPQAGTAEASNAAEERQQPMPAMLPRGPTTARGRAGRGRRRARRPRRASPSLAEVLSCATGHMLGWKRQPQESY